MDVTIALDAMGGDHGPTEIIPAALHVLNRHSNLKLVLVGQEELLLQVLAENKAVPNQKISIRPASETVEMHESPSKALRNKKDSSMRVAINMVQNDEAQACVSAGNTGALMAISRFVLKMLPGIDRPAICSTMPALQGHTHLLDLGANVDSSAEQLLQFAVMGSELASATDDLESPTIALLNVGSEEIKGNDRVKLAATLLTESHLNYVGFAEGTDIFSGRFDVIVCDGFVGNIALKASEGIAGLMTQQARKVFTGSVYGKIAAWISMPVLKEIRRKLDPRRYNGASLLGLRGIVIKSHGSADRVSFANAIEEAITEVEKNVPDRISARLEELVTESVLA